MSGKLKLNNDLLQVAPPLMAVMQMLCYHIVRIIINDAPTV